MSPHLQPIHREMGNGELVNGECNYREIGRYKRDGDVSERGRASETKYEYK